MSTFTDLLNQWIFERNLHKKDLAVKAHLSEGGLSQIVRGGRNASEPTVRSLARALELNDGETKQLLAAWRASSEELKQNRNRQNLDGIEKIHKGLPHQDLVDCICSAKKRVWILETWVVNPLRYKDAFIELARNKGADPALSVRILLLDPNEGAAEQRSKDLWIAYKQPTAGKKINAIVPMMIRSSIAEFNLLEELTEVHADFRLNTYLPPFSAYICDDQAFVGFFVHGSQSDTAPQLQVLLETGNKATAFGEMIIDEFETLWDVARPASFDKYASIV
jgi:transcriptional regulator with XRE-family HTH domain